MSDILSATRPWSYHANHNEERDYQMPVVDYEERAAEVLDYIKAHQGCNRKDLVRNCKRIRDYNHASTMVTIISNVDVELYEDDNARLYYGGVR